MSITERVDRTGYPIFSAAAVVGIIIKHRLGMLGLADKGGSDGKEPEDCLGCRLVGGGGCLGASAYVTFHASKNNHPIGRIFTFAFAGALGGVGITRLFGLPPFDKKPPKESLSSP